VTRFLGTNWLWIALIVAMLAMHRHGGCGMHGHHQQQAPERDTDHADHQQGRRSTS
jgi:hypothetical protein